MRENEYISPIKVFTQTAIKEAENYVHKAVLSLDIQVDKKELIKALEYDRKQYEKGYEAGYAAAKAEMAQHKHDKELNVSCDHDFRFYGSNYENDLFICTKCGEQKETPSNWFGMPKLL